MGIQAPPDGARQVPRATRSCRRSSMSPKASSIAPRISRKTTPTRARPTSSRRPTASRCVETLRGYKSQDGKLMIYKVMSGRKIEEDEVRELVANGEIGPLDGFVSAKTGNRFPSKIKIVDDEKNPGAKKAELDFGNKVDLNELTPFWTDPKTGAELCEAPTSYVLREREGEGWKEDFQSRPPDVPEAGHARARDPARRARQDRFDRSVHLEERPPVRRVPGSAGTRRSIGNSRRGSRAKRARKTAAAPAARRASRRRRSISRKR